MVPTQEEFNIVAHADSNWAEDPVENMQLMLRSRLLTFQWKKLVWLQRSKVAFESHQISWRRNPRWLSQMFGREVAWMWGHLGSNLGSSQVSFGVIKGVKNL